MRTLIAFTLCLFGAATVSAEVVTKDTFTDAANWNSTIGAAFSPGRYRVFGSGNSTSFIQFTATTTGTLGSIEFPVWFDNFGPVNDPSDDPYRLGVALYESLDDVFADPLRVGQTLSGISNSDWKSNVIATVAGYDFFRHDWDLNEAGLGVTEGNTYFLGMYYDPLSWVVTETPVIPLVSNDSAFQFNPAPDYAYIRQLGPPFLTSEFQFPGSQHAVRLTITAIPEPSCAAVLLAISGGLAFRRRRKV